MLGIFGVPLQESIPYAHVAISVTKDGKSELYGYIPIVVAKCGMFLKSKGTKVEGVFRVSGASKRINELQTIFNCPPKFGKGLSWEGFTVHDAANVFRRYLRELPEPIIPYDFYDKFRDAVIEDGHESDEERSIQSLQTLISELPVLNSRLLLYILDLLAVFDSNSSINLMPASNLAAIFQPGVLSHADHEMSPHEYIRSQNTLAFLIKHQDKFYVGPASPDDIVLPGQSYQGSADTRD